MNVRAGISISMRTLLLVAGMHRSGTSALTGLLTFAGAATPLHPLPATTDNQKGYFESRYFLELHEEILASIGSSWRDWRPFPRHWRYSLEAASFRDRACAFLQMEFGDARLVALKDPRICRMMPFWLDVARDAGLSPRVVVPFRSPDEVAQSLFARDTMPSSAGTLLWLRHILDAERDTRGVVRTFVPMAAMLADWRSTLERIRNQIGILGQVADVSAVDEFISGDLKHHNKLPDDVATTWAARAFEGLLSLVNEPQSAVAGEALDAVAESFEQACGLFEPIICEHETGRQSAHERDDANFPSAPASLRESDAPPPDVASVQASSAALRVRLQQLRDQLSVVELSRFGGHL